MSSLKKLIVIFSLAFIFVVSIDFGRYRIAGFLDSQKFYKFSVEKETKVVTGEIRKDFIVSQKIGAYNNNLCGLEIFMSTFNRKNTGILDISILDDKGSIIREVKKNCNEVKDNSYNNIEFEPIKDSFGKIYFLDIKSEDSTIGNAITAWYNPDNPDNNMQINEKQIKGSLVFNIIYKNDFEISNILKNTMALFVISSIVYALIKFLRK